MPSWWLIASFSKLVGIVLLSAGLLGAVQPGSTKRRTTAALTLGTLGLLVTWMGGYVVMKITERTMASPFIGESLLVSIVGLAAAWIAATRAQPAALWRALPVFGIFAALAAMVTREMAADANVLALRWVAPLILAALSTRFTAGHDPAEHDAATVRSATMAWWRWLARAEGVSYIVLLGFVTPAKYLVDWHLDPWGIVGWAHGCLVIVYVASLWPMRMWHDWSLVRLGLAFIASMMPLGTFLFERRYLER